MRRIRVIATVVFLVLAIAAVLLFWNLFANGVIGGEKCIDVNRAAGFVYDLCYDSYTKQIFMLVERAETDYELDSFTVSFIDDGPVNYNLEYAKGGPQLYKLYAEKNPKKVDLVLNVAERLSTPVCKAPQEVLVKYCSLRAPGSINYENITAFDEAVFGDDIVLAEVVEPTFDLTAKEDAWKLTCQPEWDCGEWESCEDGFRRRSCEDKTKCPIPVGAPETVKACFGDCEENWQCEWTDCDNGVMKPDCIDLNSCGTFYNRPREMSCDFEFACRPLIRCSEWSECSVDYNLLDLIGGNITGVSGVRTRICQDLNFCVKPIEETRDCSVGVDIYTKRLSYCGEEIVGIYNRLGDELIAKIYEGTGDDPFLDIVFDDDPNPYCDYCYNGVLDGDEEDVDCGGSCEACEFIVRAEPFERSEFAKAIDWLRNLFN